MSSVSQMQASKVGPHCCSGLQPCASSGIHSQCESFCIFTYSALRGTFLVVNDHDNEGSGMPVQVGMGQGLLLQKSLAGRKLPSLPFAMKPASRQVEVMAAITTQRLKAKSVQKGTQRIAPPRKPNAPKKTGTQVLKPPSVGTQVNRKVTSTSTQTCA